jgi:hypothetical protein
MKCPRKKGAVSKFQRCLAVACVMAQGVTTYRGVKRPCFRDLVKVNG